MEKTRRGGSEPAPTERTDTGKNAVSIDRIANLVLDAADGVLNLAFGLVELAFVLELFVAGDLADAFLDTALDLLAGAFDAVLVHSRAPSSRVLSTEETGAD